MAIVWTLQMGTRLSQLGLIPQMLSEHDPRKAVDQLDVGYAHAGGWLPFNGFDLSGSEGHYTILYPGDPPYKEIAGMKLRDEYIAVFPYSWVAVIQPDKTFSIARMD